MLRLNDHSQNDYKSSPIAVTVKSIPDSKDDSDPTKVFLWSPRVGVLLEPARRGEQLLCKKDCLLC